MPFSIDVDGDDWKRITPAAVMARVLKRLDAAGRGIILLHDIQPRTVAILPDLLRQLKARGYRVVHAVPAQGDTRAALAALDAPQAKPIRLALDRLGARMASFRVAARPPAAFTEEAPLVLRSGLFDEAPEAAPTREQSRSAGRSASPWSSMRRPTDPPPGRLERVRGDRHRPAFRGLPRRRRGGRPAQAVSLRRPRLSPVHGPPGKPSTMRRLGRLLPALLLCSAGAAQAMSADESPTGWWAPSLRDCADPASPRVFEIRLKPAAEARLDAHDLRCRIDKVSDTAIGYRLHMRCFRSDEDLRTGAHAEARQIVVDAIGAVTMRADGRRVYRCRARPAAAIEAPRSPAAAETPPAGAPTVPALPLPDAPMRLASLAPEPGPSGPPAPAPIPVAPAPAAPPPGVSAPVPDVPNRAGAPEPPCARARRNPSCAWPRCRPSRCRGSTRRASRPPPMALPALRRGKLVGYPGAQEAGTVVVDTAARLLYLVRGDGTAVRYRVAVGRPGTTWKGIQTVTAKQEWPQWTPTPEMRRSRPGLPRTVAGGPRNPLGARALYLGSTLYRIHGTTDPRSIGRAASAAASGC